MDRAIKINPPVSTDEVRALQAGDNVLITGTIYTGRDMAHKRLVELLQAGKQLPIDLKGQFIYYVGPSPAKPGLAVGSAGPTTSYRLDPSPRPVELGLKGMIGKGTRSAVIAKKKHGAVYFGP